MVFTVGLGAAVCLAPKRALSVCGGRQGQLLLVLGAQIPQPGFKASAGKTGCA